MTLVHVSVEIWESSPVLCNAGGCKGRGLPGQRSVPAAGPVVGAHSYVEEWSNELLRVRVLVNSVVFC